MLLLPLLLSLQSVLARPKLHMRTSPVIDAAKALARNFSGYELTPEQNDVLHAAFVELTNPYAAMSDTSKILRLLSGRVDPGDFAALSDRCGGPVPVFGASELQRVLGYADFAREVLGREGLLPLDIRVEGWKAYALVPPQWGLIRTVEGQSLLWVHDEAWAHARFFDGGEELGLCGQWPGRSKFVTPCRDFPSSKDDALDSLGLRGYPEFDKPGTLYVVRAEVNADIMEKAAPAVPLLYQIGAADSQEAAVPERWSPSAHFQEGTIPGFTSGLKAELVMQTFRMNVSSAAELADDGVSCQGLEDSGKFHV